LAISPKSTQSTVYRRFLWSKGKFATGEEYPDSVVFEVCEVSGIGFDGLNFGIDLFREDIGYIAVEIAQNFGQMLPGHPCHFFHFLHARGCRLIFPILEVELRILLVSAVPKVFEKFREIPSLGNPKLAPTNSMIRVKASSLRCSMPLCHLLNFPDKLCE
jgi:hypothetical protein